jgi:threonyl-tRNA synthetase
MMEEAEKRDHRKLGKELDLFCFSDLVGPGLPLYTPKGTILKEELQKHIESVCKKYGFQKVSAPSLAKVELFEISGHAKKFSDELFHVSSEKKHDFVLKPVQCPHQTQIYASKTRSYKDLPIRYMESDKQYRAEKTGEDGGLSRVYAITVEDGHSFCRVDQVKDEIKNMVDIIRDFYSALGLWDNHWVSLSVRDYAHPEKYIGETEDWDTCEKMLQEISDEMKLDAKKCEGEAALYGPKLDFMFKDATGREIQIPTVQIDFATPKRFGLEYVNKEGKKDSPVMVHRAILGSYERFLVLLIEHYAGAFPTWLSPVQVMILPVSEKFKDYGQNIKNQLVDSDIRAEIDDSDESLGKRIRAAKLQKIPYILVVGEKESTTDSVAVNSRDNNKPETMKIEEFLEKIFAEIKEKK